MCSKDVVEQLAIYLVVFCSGMLAAAGYLTFVMRRWLFPWRYSRALAEPKADAGGEK